MAKITLLFFTYLFTWESDYVRISIDVCGKFNVNGKKWMNMSGKMNCYDVIVWLLMCARWWWRFYSGLHLLDCTHTHTHACIIYIYMHHPKPCVCMLSRDEARCHHWRDTFVCCTFTNFATCTMHHHHHHFFTLSHSFDRIDHILSIYWKWYCCDLCYRWRKLCTHLPLRIFLRWALHVQ